MHAEHSEMARFLAGHAPFNTLPLEALERLAGQIEVSYFKSGSKILEFGEPIADLYVVRSGAVELLRKSGELYNRLSVGGVFGQTGIMLNRRVRYPARALEDSLVYCIPLSYFEAYCDEYESFADYFEAEQEGILRHALSKELDRSDLSTVKVARCLHRPPLTISPDASVRSAAQIMTQEQVSALLVMEEPAASHAQHSAHQIQGIITDSDLRSRVLAEGLSHDVEVCNIMTPSPKVLDADSYLFEAMLTMLYENVHHLPVLSRGKLQGVLALSDIVQHESQNSLLYVREIFSYQNIDSLAKHAGRLPQVFQRLVNEDANSHMIGSAMSAISRSFCQQLLHLAEEALGAPPIPYCFLSLGSLAREEQTLVTDQDNALVLDDSYREDEHGSYFAKLGEFVCQGLARCGYPLCDGDIMAQNPKWRLTLSEWQAQFADWLSNPEPQALLNSSIFFDLEGVAGELTLAVELQSYLATEAPKHPRFLACLARNALNRTPPLGFFKEFVVEPDGAYRDTINLKRRGTAPLTDVIRVHALAIGSSERNSFRRLDDIAESDLLPEGKCLEITDALEYLSIIRVQHQAKALAQGKEANNQLNPKTLSAFERRSLKAAFQVIDNAQKFLKFRYTANQPIR